MNASECLLRFKGGQATVADHVYLTTKLATQELVLAIMRMSALVQVYLLAYSPEHGLATLEGKHRCPNWSVTDHW